MTKRSYKQFIVCVALQIIFFTNSLYAQDIDRNQSCLAPQIAVATDSLQLAVAAFVSPGREFKTKKGFFPWVREMRAWIVLFNKKVNIVNVNVVNDMPEQDDFTRVIMKMSNGWLVEIEEKIVFIRTKEGKEIAIDISVDEEERISKRKDINLAFSKEIFQRAARKLSNASMFKFFEEEQSVFLIKDVYSNIQILGQIQQSPQSQDTIIALRNALRRGFTAKDFFSWEKKKRQNKYTWNYKILS